MAGSKGREAQIPDGGRHVIDEQREVVRTLLVAMLSFLLLVLSLGLFLNGPRYLLTRGPLLMLLLALAAAVALARLRKGISQAIWLVVVGSLAALAVETIAHGIVRPSPPFLFAYAVPLVFAGLLAGRRALLFTVVVGVGVVALAYIGEVNGWSWVGRAQVPDAGILSLLFFALVMGFTAIALERFGTSIGEAHLALLGRQKEQERLLGELRLEVERRERVEAEQVALLANERRAREQNEMLLAQLQGLNTELERRIEERARELNEIRAELDTYVFSAAHGMRTPLRGIDGWAQLLLEDYGDRLDDEGRVQLQKIRQGAHRLGELSDDIVNMSRLTHLTLEIEPLDVSEIARWVVQEVAKQEPDRQVEVEIEEWMSGFGDRRLVTAVLESLLDNAWKFTRSVPDARVEVGWRRDSGRTVYYVRDNGIGFDSRYADKLFVPFQTLHSPDLANGSGIGLALAHRLLLRLGGSIWAEVNEEGGATFYFTLGG